MNRDGTFILTKFCLFFELCSKNKSQNFLKGFTLETIFRPKIFRNLEFSNRTFSQQFFNKSLIFNYLESQNLFTHVQLKKHIFRVYDKKLWKQLVHMIFDIFL